MSHEDLYAPADEQPASMTVTVIDRAAADTYNWGPHFKTITLPAVCPECGGPRGEVRNHRFREHGDWYDVDVWDNPCGHVDNYRDVIEEAKRLQHDIVGVTFTVVQAPRVHNGHATVQVVEHRCDGSTKHTERNIQILNGADIEYTVQRRLEKSYGEIVTAETDDAAEAAF